MNSTRDNIMIIRYPPRYPKSVHLYITNECNLDCEKCYYRKSSDPKKELSLEQIRMLLEEWKRYKLTSIAIGGGEPLLHPDINEIIQLAKDMGFFIAVTTNGTVLRPIKPNRVHISYDELHPTWKDEKLIQKAIDYYHNLGCVVGINHIVTNLENIEYIEQSLHNFTNLLLIRQKPESLFTQWDEIPYRKSYWIEGCREGSICEQGILSFHLNYDMQSSICSNLQKKIPYTNLNETWEKLKVFKCRIRDSNKIKKK
ncbi:MAG: radical SAM protein [Promethearchaeota archaeon]|nr:MAG: radical SAM protein [Candidatus Lokiarchaeota archaeon]